MSLSLLDSPISLSRDRRIAKETEEDCHHCDDYCILMYSNIDYKMGYLAFYRKCGCCVILDVYDMTVEEVQDALMMTRVRSHDLWSSLAFDSLIACPAGNRLLICPTLTSRAYPAQFGPFPLNASSSLSRILCHAGPRDNFVRGVHPHLPCLT